ncbi:hypothetical protein Fcan01_16533 [Folsomia candida]|uniref:Uncharacterized protein n=1 Tax=Folsomia candida TaxID=158441 RepID=A0A226DUP6_FOLCA|nr:hypothetical protein Fcan01_16533 [Folsomia candida]
MSQQKFSVVYFPSGKTIEVVPRFRKIQKDSSSTPDLHWPIWEVEIKKSYDDFSDIKAKKLLSASYVDSSENDAAQNVNHIPESNSGEDQEDVEDVDKFVST